MTDIRARAFRGFRFPAEVILWAVRWYLRFPVSYRELELMLADRGVAVDHTTMYRAVDGTGQTIDFLLCAKRDKKAARRFFKRALGRENTRNPREVVTDRLKSYPGALREMKQKGELWRFARHRRGRWLNNRVEQDHRQIKRLTRPMLGFQGFWRRSARWPASKQWR